MEPLNWVLEIKRRGAVLGMHYLCFGMNKYVPYLYGVPFIYNNVLYIDSSLSKVKEEDDLLKALIREAFEHDHDYFLNIVSRIRTDGSVVKSFAHHFLQAEAVSDTEQKELARLFSSYISLMSHFGTYFRFMEPSVSTLEALMLEMLRVKIQNQSDIQEAFLALSVSPFHDYVTAERRSLLKIAADADRIVGRDRRKALSLNEYVELIRKQPELLEKLEQHELSYSWMGTADHLGSPYTIEQYATFIQDLGVDDIEAELARLAQHDKQRTELTRKFEERLSFSPREAKLVQSIQQYDYVNAFVKEVVLSNQQRAEYLLTRISRILEVDREILISLTFEEILLALQERGPLNASLRRKAKERSDDWAMLISGKDINIYSGEELKSFKAQFQEPDFSNLTQVQGTAANVGRVTATAKVINSVKEFGKLRRGDIVITSMTTPEYSAVMDRIAGIVTDEGGVTSHAGSIAREKGIPCLVGTRIATKVFVDGDEVELDAGAGVARKIVAKS